MTEALFEQVVLVTIGSTNIFVQASKLTDVVVVSGFMTSIRVDSSCMAGKANLLAIEMVSSKLLPILMGSLLLDTRDAANDEFDEVEEDEEKEDEDEEQCAFTDAAVDSITSLQDEADIGEEQAEFVFVALLVHNFDIKSLGVMRPSYVPVPESGLGHTEPEGDWQMGDEPRLSQNIFFAGGCEYSEPHELVEEPSSNSNFLLTGPN